MIPIDTGTASTAIDEASDAPDVSTSVPAGPANTGIDLAEAAETPPDDDTDDDGWGGF